MKLNKKKIYITFEIGPTHSGLKSCKKFCKLVAKSGADAIKLQIINADKLVSDKKIMFDYKVLSKSNRLKKKKESLHKILKRRELSYKEIKEIKNYCDKLKLEFFATVSFPEDIIFLKKIGCKSIKIASADLNYEMLLIQAAKSKMLIQLDTGMATLNEIETAVKIIKKFNNNKILIHQCPSGYPAGVESIDLNMIKSIKKRFKLPVAFSDHSPGYDMDIAAVAMGVNLVEKTITFNRYTPSVEHVMSIDVKDIKEFVKKIKETKIALGRTDRKLMYDQKKKRNDIRRSAFYNQNLNKGKKISIDDIIFRRPAIGGIQPEEINKIKGKKLKKNVKLFQRISLNHFV